MILTNIDYVPGYEVAEALGLAKGSTIRAKHLGKDIVSVFRHMVGGELKEYGEMIAESRKIATARMVEEAETLGADAYHQYPLHDGQCHAGGRGDPGLWNRCKACEEIRPILRQRL